MEQQKATVAVVGLGTVESHSSARENANNLKQVPSV